MENVDCSFFIQSTRKSRVLKKGAKEGLCENGLDELFSGDLRAEEVDDRESLNVERDVEVLVGGRMIL